MRPFRWKHLIKRLAHIVRPQQWLTQIISLSEARSGRSPHTAAGKLEKEDLRLIPMRFFRHIKQACLRAFAHAASTAWDPLSPDLLSLTFPEHPVKNTHNTGMYPASLSCLIFLHSASHCLMCRLCHEFDFCLPPRECR